MVKTKRILLVAAISLFVLSVFDSFITDYGLRNMLIEEANPIMRTIYNESVLAFYSVKLFLPALLILIVMKLKSTKTLRVFMMIALLIYIIVFLQHILWLSLFLIYS